MGSSFSNEGKVILEAGMLTDVNVHHWDRGYHVWLPVGAKSSVQHAK
jgi:hypothetical protein